MLVTESRPRNLTHWHAGPLLYGDWGTSRLYVLGLAFFYTAHASVIYLAALGLVMAGVAWAYTIICRKFPDGGGTYAAARQINPTLSVLGATLLVCDYIVTVALSTIEAFHYLGVPHDLALILAVSSIVVLGVVNWVGARVAGRLALLIAVLAIGVSLILALMVLPLLPAGLEAMSWNVPGVSSSWERWESLVRIMLALAGIEAVANMTGIMRQPVARTSKRTIWPVLLEVVVLNIVFGIALAGLPELVDVAQPHAVTFDGANAAPVPPEVREYRDTAMRTIATHTGASLFGSGAGASFGVVSGIVFALLLFSAANTAIMAMVSVLYSMARDRELPGVVTRLNYSGVPWVALIIACAVSIVVLLVERDVARLAELYAIGVVGAIVISLLSTSLAKANDLRRRDKIGLMVLGGFMALVELTIIVAKPNATVFAGAIVGTVLISRGAMLRRRRKHPEPIAEPEAGWLTLVNRMPTDLDPTRPRIMLAARGRYQSEFAVDTARRRNAVLFAIYVRTLRILDTGPRIAPLIAEDRQAQAALGSTALLAQEAGVPFVPIYVVSDDITGEILDYTVTFGCDTLIMGKSRRSLLSRKVEGDVVRQVAGALPDEVALITRSADKPHRKLPSA